MLTSLPTIGPGLSPAQKARFFTDAAGLLEAGLGLGDALVLLGEGQGKRMRGLTGALLSGIEEGWSLAGAMRDAKAFAGLDIMACEVGERSARLAEVFRNLGTYYAGRTTLRRSMLRAASYPLMVMSMSLAALLVMSVWVIPGFAGYYEQSGAELPRLTLGLLRFADALPRTVLAFGLVTVAVMGGDRLLQRSGPYNDARDHALSGLPLIGPWRRDAALERFCTMLGLMMGSGLSLSRSLDLLARHDPSVRVRRTSSSILSRLADGSSLSSAMNDSGAGGPMLWHLVAMGEETGRLPLAFDRAARRYRERLERRSEVAGNWFEPILVIVSGGLVALMLAGLYLPMFDVGKMFG